MPGRIDPVLAVRIVTTSFGDRPGGFNTQEVVSKNSAPLSMSKRKRAS